MEELFHASTFREALNWGQLEAMKCHGKFFILGRENLLLAMFDYVEDL
jgi:hypothetical protein